MKIIISRKGFDWSNGHTPSPILPDGTLLSMPIPSDDDMYFGCIYHKDMSYLDILEQLKPTEDFMITGCHLDPDIRKSNRTSLPEGWVPAFGQIDAAETHLENQGVEVGDLFLFFGWFGETKEKNGQLKYVSSRKDLHVIWGYLQIGKISRGKDCLNYPWHPHYYNYGNNTIYEASEKLVIDGVDTGLPGAGCLKYSDEVVLTKPGETRSRWLLPDFFKEVNISCHSRDSFKPEGYFQTVKIGQEFVVSEDDRVTQWAKNIILNNYDSEAEKLNTEIKEDNEPSEYKTAWEELGMSEEEYDEMLEKEADEMLSDIDELLDADEETLAEKMPELAMIGIGIDEATADRLVKKGYGFYELANVTRDELLTALGPKKTDQTIKAINERFHKDEKIPHPGYPATEEDV